MEGTSTSRRNFVVVHGKKHFMTNEFRLDLGPLQIKDLREIENINNIAG
nr:hypothetical protein [Candidatus Sigynarchaeota archaeon]